MSSNNEQMKSENKDKLVTYLSNLEQMLTNMAEVFQKNNPEDFAKYASKIPEYKLGLKLARAVACGDKAILEDPTIEKYVLSHVSRLNWEILKLYFNEHYQNAKVI